MANQTSNLATKYQSKIAERFQKASITDSACGNEYKFEGEKTIKISSVNVVEETDYSRTADGNRFGNVYNLGDTMQEMTMTQEKSFTFAIEALDNSDQAIDKSAAGALKRQLNEVTIPTMDKYRIKRWCQQANIQSTVASLSKDTIGDAIVELNAAMTDALVPLEGRTLYINTANYIYLKRDPAWISVEDLAKDTLQKGQVGQFDGLAVKPVPNSYLPDGVHFMIKLKGSSVDPVKMELYRVLKEVQGYAGPIVEGLTYYDAFVLGTKGDGVAVCGTSAFVLAAPAITVTAATGSTAVTAVSGVVFYYTTDGTNPRYSTTALPYTAAVVLADGETIRVIGTKDGCCGMGASKTYTAS